MNSFPLTLIRLRLISRILNISCCIQDAYYENKITFEKYCEDCFRLNLNQNPSNFYKIFTHRARLFCLDHELTCSNCNHSITRISPVYCCDICFETVNDFLSTRDTQTLTDIVLNSAGDPTILFLDYRRDPAVSTD